ncbi:MAG: endolytic transglycosylase MltG [Oscillospiraceae bacterium]|jgi:UPF0755 protein|nr:endolytic transglycosylase MltG [Oscillospiraceae bacterium]
MAEKRTPGGEERRSSNVRPNFVVNIDDHAYGAPPADSAGTPRFGTEISPSEFAGGGKRGVYFASTPSVTPQKPTAPAVRRSNQVANKTRKQSSGESTARSLLISLILVACSGLLALWGGVCMNDILAFDRDGTDVVVNIPENADTDTILKILKDEKLIRQKWFCKLFNKIFHTSKDKNGKIIPPKYLNGVYYVKNNEGLEGLLNTFKSLPVSAKTITVVFPEGYTTFQMFQRLEEMGVCHQDHLYKALQDVKFYFKFVEKIPENDPNRPFRLEGYLFPAQYDFYEGEDANSVIRRMLDAFDKRWTAAYQKKADQLGMTMDQVITLASIIEKEAGDAGQMSGISYVVHNRLNHAASWPSIGCDSTKEYITKFAKARMLSSQVEAFAKLYNTNGNAAIKGLPPGPICSPGKAAIEAALNPESPDGKPYLFFQHDKYGKIYYELTLADFERDLQNIRAMDISQ